MPEDSDFLCGGWIWDAVMKELRYHQRARKGWKDEPEQVERLERAVRSVTWRRWSQAPMQTSTGAMMPSSLSRIVVAFEGGGDITLNENDRACAEKLSRAIADASGVEVAEEGAPGGRRSGNLPPRDEMGRLVTRSGKAEVTLDDVAREITIAKARFPVGKSRRTVSFAEVRRLELTYEANGPLETFTLWAIVTPEEERLAIASYQGYEGWAEPQEWRDFARDVAATIGVAVTGADEAEREM
ncbi:MAG: hypothetical protein WD379_04205 [Dehalococcoidia bacterium]